LIHNWLLLFMYIILTATYPGASALNSTDALKKKFVQTVIGVAIGHIIIGTIRPSRTLCMESSGVAE
jgi:hypothetical protein